MGSKSTKAKVPGCWECDWCGALTNVELSRCCECGAPEHHDKFTRYSGIRTDKFKEGSQVYAPYVPANEEDK